MTFKDISFKPRNGEEVRSKGRTLSTELLLNGFNPKLSLGLVEILRNAYEHGNKGDLSKKIIFKKNIESSICEFVIGDEGKDVNEDFFNYIKSLNSGNYFNAKSFYDFNKIPQKNGHGGVGVKMAHILFDNVVYEKNKDGGLLVYLSKSK